jgi:type 1 glutamine amidotransferase
MLSAMLLVLLLASCGDDATGTDAGTDAGARRDAGAIDAGPEAERDASTDAGDPGPIEVVVFSRTEGFPHDSIGAGITALNELALANGWTLTATEEPSELVSALDDADVAVFLMTTGDVLDPPEEAAFEAWFRAGHGYVGVHSASDTEYDWAWYGMLVGAYFADHPAIQEAALVRERADHAAVAHLPERWIRTDEWYNFRANPRAEVEVLLSIDEASYRGGTMGDHPMAWAHEFDGGRAFYTALGHTRESYAEPDFRAHLAGAIAWAADR